MVVKTHFELTVARAVKLRRIAEYQAQQQHLATDTAATLNALIERAYELMEEEKRASTRRAYANATRQP